MSFLSEHKYWLGFSLVPEIGTKRILNLLDKFGSLSNAWIANHVDLLEAGLEEKRVNKLVQFRKKINLDYEYARIERVRARMITLIDADYPPLLKQIADPPTVLYIRGTLTPQDEHALCIVGTRKASPTGRETAKHIAYRLVEQGLTVVSGLAQGIDEAAHRGALEGKGRLWYPNRLSRTAHSPCT
jgi:DNA processing protein